MDVAGRLRKALKTTAAAMAVVPAAVPAAEAGWYTADGRADILYDDVQKARNEAINDALRSIMLEAGADINVSADYQGGALMNESFNIKSSSPVRKLTILEEQRTLSSVTVKVRAFVDEDRTVKCVQSSVRKSILPLIFRFADDRAYQSAIGLDELPRELSATCCATLAIPPPSACCRRHSSASLPISIPQARRMLSSRPWRR